MNFRFNFLIFILFLIFPRLEAKVISFGVIADAGHPSEKTNLVRKSILQSGVKKLILPGDNIYDLTLSYHDVWESWSGFDFSIVALGNHHQSYLEEMDYFYLPGEYYLKNIDGIQFIVLNSDNKDNIKEQKEFLVKSLKESNIDKPLFIVFHHPPATISYRHHWQERKDFHALLRPILMRYSHRIDGLIVGHDHQASIFKFGEIPVIVSGAIFEFFPARSINQNVGGINVQTLWHFDKGYYWTRLDVDTNTGETWVNFINVERDSVDCSVRIKRNGRPFLRPNCRK